MKVWVVSVIHGEELLDYKIVGVFDKEPDHEFMYDICLNYKGVSYIEKKEFEIQKN